MFTSSHFELINADAAKIYLDLCDARTYALENKLLCDLHLLSPEAIALAKAEILESRSVAREAHGAWLDLQSQRRVTRVSVR